MNDRPGGKSSVFRDSTGNTLYKKNFWSKEGLKYSRPHYRLEKSARIVNRLARGKRLTLLDVGCGPAALMPLLRSNIKYYGIDIAIHNPAPNLIEADLLRTPIRFDDKRFDIVIAQGFFEYMGTFQAQKFAEISQILNDDGIFIASYVNFGHRDRRLYWPYSNVQPLNDFRQGLVEYFKIKRSVPTSHNWHHSEPGRKFIKTANMHTNISIPFISPVLVVEYFFICTKLSLSSPRRTVPFTCGWMITAADEEAIGKVPADSHPTGTTRMADDPACGVVDSQCQVHGVDGLFIAGTSVFPTVGHVNPTQMIVAMAVRLADALRARGAVPLTIGR